MKVTLYPFELHLLHPFTTSHSTKTTQRTLLLALEGEGVVGYGEAAESPVFGVTVASMCRELSEVRTLVEQTKWHAPEELYEAIKKTRRLSAFSCCALDMAMHDWYGKQKEQKLYEAWGLQAGPSVVSSFTIGMDTPEVMRKKMAERPWPIYKIKVGEQTEMAVLSFLREHTRARFRVDANCGWRAADVLAHNEQLRAWGVELIEQPLPVHSTDQPLLFARSSLPVIADESCEVEEDIDRCVGRFHGVNIKLSKAGGLTPALRMIQKARENDLKVMVGCMVESSVGISAIAHLLSLLDYVDMDGALLITNDPAAGVRVTEEGVIYAEGNGTGARLRAPLTPAP